MRSGGQTGNRSVESLVALEPLIGSEVGLQALRRTLGALGAVGGRGQGTSDAVREGFRIPGWHQQGLA
jgi:hypothetical protein